MWKCATRTIKATLGKKISRNSTVLTTRTPQDFNILVKLVPTLIKRFNRCYGSCRNTCGNYSKEKKEKKGPKENKNSFIGTFDNNVFEFLGWGGVFMLAYFLLQPLERRRLFPSFEECGKLPLTISGYQKTLQYVINSVGVKSYNSVLPEVQGVSDIRQPSGPQSTPSENLKKEKSFSGLEKAHQKVMGTLTNWLGTQYMQSGKHKKALELFAQAAEDQNPAGLFNLGICHERGLGTSQNAHRAAELYQKAADLGHASAMYNLGVFYARGIGGIGPDPSQARELFTAAASLGQTDAVKALNLEKQTSEDLPKSFAVESEKETVSDIIRGSILNYSNRDCESCGGGVKECCYSSELNSDFGSDSGVLDLSPENESHLLFT